jgi:hypothetical protein
MSDPRPVRTPSADLAPRAGAADVAAVACLAAGLAAVFRLRVAAPPDARYVTGVGDIFGYFLLAYTYQAERMAAGSLPFWNPYQGAGVPFLATLQPGALYPARLLLLVATPTAAIGWSTFLHALLALLGTYALCRRLGTSVLAAAMAGVVFTTAFALPWIHSTTLLEPGAWLPLLALAVVAILRGGGWGWVLVLGAGTAMPLLAGGYQMSIYVVYALALVALAVVLDDLARGRPLPVRAFGRLAVAALLAVATAAPQVLPTVAWSAETMRQTKLLTDIQMMPLFTEDARWHRLVVFFFRVSSSDVAYLSVPVIALAALGVVAARPMGTVFGLVALVTALFTMMPVGSVLFAIYKAIPGFGMFRFPSRLLVLTSFFTAVTAALGLSRATRFAALAPAGRRILLELAALAVVVALLVLPYRNELPVAWTAGPQLTSPDPRFFPGNTKPPPEYRAWVPGGRLDLRAGMFVRQGMRQHVRVLQDYEPLSSGRLGTFLAAAAGLPPPGTEALSLFTGALIRDPFITRPELLDLVAVRSVMVPEKGIASRVSGWTNVATTFDLKTFRNDNALPRAYVVPRARFVADETAALDTLKDATFDGHAEVVLVGAADGPVARTVASAPAAPATPARFVRDDPEHVVVAVDPAAPGVLVLADAFAPGWTATVDGAPREILQANYLVRGVLLAPHDREVEFRYRAPGFLPGLALLAAGWGVVLVGLAVARAARRAPART